MSEFSDKIEEYEPQKNPSLEAQIVSLADESKRGEALKELVIRTLKDSVPDATDEEINKIALQYFQQLTEAIMEVNGLKNVTPPTAS